MLKKILKWNTAFVLGLLTAGCATSPPLKAPPATAVSKTGGETSLDIAYMLARNQYRLEIHAPAEGQEAHLRYLLDKKVLREGNVEPERFLEFLAKVRQYMAQPQRTLAQNDPCYGPFTLTLKQGTEVKQVSGCRSGDNGTLSHLIREGEFLLYSQK